MFAPWSPGYHLVQLLKGENLSVLIKVYHTIFNLIFFLIGLKTVSQYSLFYFSNNREKRYSQRLSVLIVCFCLCLIVSGLFVSLYTDRV